MLTDTATHLLNNVLPAAADYVEAEDALSTAYSADQTPAAWESVARTAKRRAAELAIAIDGLTDRSAEELGLSKSAVRNAVSTLCCWPDSAIMRPGARDRVPGVANAYKHRTLNDPTLPITSEADILVVGLGYGLDGYGVGKPGGVEVLVRERGGDTLKVLGDTPVAISAWFKFLASRGAVLPSETYTICDQQLHP